MNALLELVKQKDSDAAKILAEIPIVISIRGSGANLSEIKYEDRWGSQFKTTIEWRG